jgi:hypothetical protein
MRLPSCASCGRLVLELEGQFEKLDSYFIDGQAPPPETAGWWHASCLASSASAPAWYEARLRNHQRDRGWQLDVELKHWTVVRHAQSGEVLAFGRSGELLSLSLGRGRGRSVDGGAVYSIAEPMFNLQLDDEAAIGEIQRVLDLEGVYPLTAVLDTLGIRDLIVHPVAIESGVFRLMPELRDYWTRRAVAVRAEYGVFVPAELELYVTDASH